MKKWAFKGGRNGGKNEGRTKHERTLKKVIAANVKYIWN